MARFAANLTFLFTELPLLDRFAAARRAGFSGVEMLFPYDVAAPGLAKSAAREDLKFVLLNAPPPNWSGGQRGFAAIPEAAARFRRDFNRALRFAEVLGAQHIHLMAGKAEGRAARDTYIENLTWAADRAPHASLTIEPLNAADVPGYFLNDFDQAAEIIAAVDRPNLGLQFDSYHAHMLTGDVFATWQRHAALVSHIQIGGAPGRHEPSLGAVDHARFFDLVDECGYRGWISAEYVPSATTEAGLGWLPKAWRGAGRRPGRRTH